jgi:acyl-CoA thioesterase
VSRDADDLLARWNACGYYELVGMEVLRADEAGSDFRIAIDERHLQAYGTGHGGVIAGLLDAAMGLAVLGRLPPGEGASTVEMKLNFTSAARPGMLGANGEVLYAGRRIVTACARAHDAGGRLVAAGQGTFARFELPEDE